MPPPSPHFEAGPSVFNPPHGRLGWVGWGGWHSRPPPWLEPDPQPVGDQELESRCFQRERHWLQGPVPPRPVHHGGSDRRHWGHCPLMAPARVEPRNARYAL